MSVRERALRTCTLVEVVLRCIAHVGAQSRRSHHCAAVLSVASLVACQPDQSIAPPCDCDSADAGTQKSIAAEARLRGPRFATDIPRVTAIEDDEHPHPDYPRLIDRNGNDSAGVRRLRRDAPRTLTLPMRSGLLHAHTWYSDGSGTPADAFARAKSLGLDFLAVTPHNHDKAEMGAIGERRDGVLVADDPLLFEGDDDVTFTRNWTIDGEAHSEEVTSASLVSAADAATDDDFVALVGQEFSSISSGNHVNVIGWRQLVTVANGDFSALYSGFGDATPVLQLNHPNVHQDLFYRGSLESTRRKMFNDYGFDDFDEDFAELVAAADPTVMLVEVLTGPAFAQTAHATFNYKHHEKDYYYYLVQGFHISPSVGHDNHFRTWGDATPARMGVFSAENSAASLLDAMRSNRTFASEDADLRVDFFVNAAAMGDVLEMAENEPLRPRVHVEDASDGDGEYLVELIYGNVEPQSKDDLVKWVPDDGLTESLTFIGSGQVQFDTYLAAGIPEFFYVRVTQEDGDQAWSAPIWVNHPRSYEVN